MKINVSALPRQFRICQASAETGLVLEAQGGEGEGGERKLRRFRMTAYTGGRLELAGFPLPVVVDLAGTRVPAKSRPVLRDHDPGRIVGHTQEITVNAGSIRVVGVISGVGESAREIAQAADNGFPWQASIGASAQRLALVDEGESVQVNNRNFTGPLLVARQTTLREVSFVALGADDNTSARFAAQAAPKEDAMNFSGWLTAKGFDLDTLTPAQQAYLRGQFEAEQKAAATRDSSADPSQPEAPANPLGAQAPAATAPPDGAAAGDDWLKARREAEAAEVERVESIRAVVAKYDRPTISHAGACQSLEAVAIREGWDRDKTELEALRASRPQAPAIHASGLDAGCQRDAIAAGMVLREGRDLDQRTSRVLVDPATRRPWTAERAQRAFEAGWRYRDLSLVDLCREAVRLEGRSVDAGDRSELIRAAVSTATLANIFTTSVNARVLAGYLEAADTTDWVSSVVDVPDYKPNERVLLGKGGALAKLARGDEAKHVTYADAKESYKIARYAAQFVVDEQDIIDDRFGALSSQTPEQLGAAAARLRPDLVYSILLANANLADGNALFSAAHNNTGALAFSKANLEATIAKMMKQTQDGVRLNLRPRFLLVPGDLEFTARELLTSAQLVIAGSSDQLRGNRNVLVDLALQLRVEGRIDAAGVVDPDSGTKYSGSATTWFLASDQNTIEVGYLRGTGRRPALRSFTLDRGRWGIGWDINLDIGAKALDYRGLARGNV
jgi:hypothetical protein